MPGGMLQGSLAASRFAQPGCRGLQKPKSKQERGGLFPYFPRDVSEDRNCETTTPLCSTATRVWSRTRFGAQNTKYGMIKEAVQVPTRYSASRRCGRYVFWSRQTPTLSPKRAQFKPGDRAWRCLFLCYDSNLSPPHTTISIKKLGIPSALPEINW